MAFYHPFVILCLIVIKLLVFVLFLVLRWNLADDHGLTGLFVSSVRIDNDNLELEDHVRSSIH